MKSPFTARLALLNAEGRGAEPVDCNWPATLAPRWRQISGFQSGTMTCFSATSFVAECSDGTWSGPMFYLFMHPAVITALNMTTT